MFGWNASKNEWLARVRGVTFERVIYHMAHGGLLDVLEHPNQAKYPGQRLFVVQVEEYVYVVPFVEAGDEVFLKTIIPSRKLTRRYLRTSDG